jgi:hypothetical protein
MVKLKKLSSIVSDPIDPRGRASYSSCRIGRWLTICANADSSAWSVRLVFCLDTAPASRMTTRIRVLTVRKLSTDGIRDLGKFLPQYVPVGLCMDCARSSLIMEASNQPASGMPHRLPVRHILSRHIKEAINKSSLATIKMPSFILRPPALLPHLVSKRFCRNFTGGRTKG